MRGEDTRAETLPCPTIGSPPHARGRRWLLLISLGHLRITPACAGKTRPAGKSPTFIKDHPRMRGEDRLFQDRHWEVLGSPPHARGRLDSEQNLLADFRITPACAGKTSTVYSSPRLKPDHPRMRGEDKELAHQPSDIGGSPPHARGRRDLVGRAAPGCRITPACAGKTSLLVFATTIPPDHPRMRGEDKELAHQPSDIGGSPPHARGRRDLVGRAAPGCRITPACAGKTRFRSAGARRSVDHPRMRGEDRNVLAARSAAPGSPPHARGRRYFIVSVVEDKRITPACAGKTQTLDPTAGRTGDHPRMRGED